MTASTLMTKTKKDLVDLILKQEKEVSRLTGKLNENSAQINTLRGDIKSITKKYDEAVKANKGYDSIIEDKNKVLSARNSEIAKLDRKIEQLNADVLNANSLVASKEKEISKLNDSFGVQSSVVNSLNAKVKDCNNKIDELSRLNESYKDEIDNFTTFNQVLIIKCSRYKTFCYITSIICLIIIILMAVY